MAGGRPRREADSRAGFWAGSSAALRRCGSISRSGPQHCRPAAASARNEFGARPAQQNMQGASGARVRLAPRVHANLRQSRWSKLRQAALQRVPARQGFARAGRAACRGFVGRNAASLCARIDRQPVGPCPPKATRAQPTRALPLRPCASSIVVSAQHAVVTADLGFASQSAHTTATAAAAAAAARVPPPARPLRRAGHRDPVAGSGGSSSGGASSGSSSAQPWATRCRGTWRGAMWGASRP